MNKLGLNFKKTISKWCRIKIKIFKMPGKDKKVKDHLFDSGKCQFTFHQLADKIDEVITEIDLIPDMINTAVSEAVTPIQNELTTHMADGWSSSATGDGPHGHMNASDRRLKTDINFVGISPSGINIYTFRFINSKMYGEGLYQGVLSDEVPTSVVTKDTNDYDMVNYNQIDVDFVQVNKV